MKLGNSEILKISLRKLFPFIIMFSFYIVSYGTSYPGGGFQAGVVAGTLVVIYGVIFDREHFNDKFYKIIEFITLICFLLLVIFGIVFYSNLFLWITVIQKDSLIFSNVFFFFMNFLIFFEVNSSIILIFRNIIKGYQDE
ncbi:MAG: MnhB domain-containing protein [Candidatus Muirbacterium halophilum]|nr:MnhB domain-containing protein [Candidatus Muirbacterium halophilum]MCK9476121.1 MnhB domain-containing protein [Candidatus Muirbacterium halophilum]